MANPFEASFDSDCPECGRTIFEGDKTFAHDGGFVCEQCAEDLDIICPECGRYKKPEYDTCFKCSEGGDELEVW